MKTQLNLIKHTHIQILWGGTLLTQLTAMSTKYIWDCRKPFHPLCENNIVKTGRILMMLFEPQTHSALGKQPKQKRVSFLLASLDKYWSGWTQISLATLVVGGGQSPVIASFTRATWLGGSILQWDQKKRSRKQYLEKKNHSYYVH